MDADKNIEKFDKMMLKYEAGLKVLETQIEIINNDFKNIKKYNPIEHIKTRIKSIDSLKRKLEKKNIEFTVDNIENNINDVIGVRIICAFLEDVNELIKIIKSSSLIKVIKEKDYITNPKDSGYRSYHFVVEVPVSLLSGNYMVRAEIQIRTLAMDLWASLEHKLSYKSDYVTEDIQKRLYEISDELDQIDEEMTELVETENRIKLMYEEKEESENL